MNIQSLIVKYGAMPFSHQTIVDEYKHYSNANDKIHQLIQQQKLLKVRRGLYVFNNAFTQTLPSSILLANHIYGPSYVSLDFALQYYGAIPEKVYEVSSVTIKKSKLFSNHFGIFSYALVPKNYFSVGVIHIELPDKLNGLIATPEKALIDKIICTKGIVLRSQLETSNLLLQNWRIDRDWLKSLNALSMKEWLIIAPKKNSINQVIKFLKKL